MRGTIERITNTLGSINIFVADAGGIGGGSVDLTTDEAWDEAARNTLNTAFICSRKALSEFIEQRGLF